MATFSAIVCTGRIRQPEGDCVVLDVMHGTIARGGRSARLTPYEFWIAAAILSARGVMVTNDDIIEVLYAHAADGGPDSANVIVRSRICYLRPRLAMLSIKIVNIPWRGYCAELEPLPALASLVRAA